MLLDNLRSDGREGLSVQEGFDLIFIGDVLVQPTLYPLSRSPAALAPLCRGQLVLAQMLPDGPQEPPAMRYVGGARSSGRRPHFLVAAQSILSHPDAHKAGIPRGRGGWLACRRPSSRRPSVSKSHTEGTETPIVSQAVAAVEVHRLSKNYPLFQLAAGPLAWHLFGSAKHAPHDGLWALREVSFSVDRGEAFGIIGANGSGKSTLLQIIAGILTPTSGTVRVNGRLSALLELGSGFSPEFTGRDNVYLNASLLGLSRDEIDARFADIERFAGITVGISSANPSRLIRPVWCCASPCRCRACRP